MNTSEVISILKTYQNTSNYSHRRKEDQNEYPKNRYYKQKKGPERINNISYQAISSFTMDYPQPGGNYKNETENLRMSKERVSVSVATSPLFSSRKKTILSKHNPEKGPVPKQNKRLQLSMSKPQVVFPNINLKTRTIKEMMSSGFHKMYNADLIK